MSATATAGPGFTPLGVAANTLREIAANKCEHTPGGYQCFNVTHDPHDAPCNPCLAQGALNDLQRMEQVLIAENRATQYVPSPEELAKLEAKANEHWEKVERVAGLEREAKVKLLTMLNAELDQGAASMDLDRVSNLLEFYVAMRKDGRDF